MKNFLKLISSLCICASIVVVYFTFFSTKANEESKVNNVTNDVLYLDYENSHELDNTMMEEMNPIFTSLGVQMSSDNSIYDSNDEFIASAMEYLAFYNKDLLNGKYEEDYNNMYIDENIFYQLAQISFFRYDITQNSLVKYDENKKSYVISKKNFPQNVNCEIESVVNIDGCKNAEFYNIYKVVVNINKGLFSNTKIKFTLVDSEFLESENECLYKYAIKNAEIM